MLAFFALSCLNSAIVIFLTFKALIQNNSKQKPERLSSKLCILQFLMREAEIELKCSRKVTSILNYSIDDYYCSVDYILKMFNL